MPGKNDKVLVTGADGFIGSHLTELLLHKGHPVKALSYYNSFNNWGWLEDIAAQPNLEIVSGDIRDPHFCKQLVKDVEVVYHLAALIAIPYSYIAPDSYVETNIKGTINICQAARENGNIKVIHTSTSEVYGTAQYVPIDEKHPKQPQSPYSASKIGADAMAMSFYHAFNLPVAIARPFNTYGPRQSARAIIPTIISQMLAGIREIRLGDLRPTRDLNFVADTCRALWELSNCEEAIGKEINISSNEEISMGGLVELIKEILNLNVDITEDPDRIRPTMSEVFRLRGDNNLLKKLIGFKSEYSLKQGLQISCDWFKNPENLKKYKSNIYNV